MSIQKARVETKTVLKRAESYKLSLRKIRITKKQNCKTWTVKYRENCCGADYE